MTIPADFLGKIPKNFSLENYLNDIEKKIILSTLDETKWNRTLAAKVLGLTFRALRYKLKKLGLDDSIEGAEEEEE